MRVLWTLKDFQVYKYICITKFPSPRTLLESNNAARVWVILNLYQCLQNKSLERFKFIAKQMCYYNFFLTFL